MPADTFVLTETAPERKQGSLTEHARFNEARAVADRFVTLVSTEGGKRFAHYMNRLRGLLKDLENGLDDANEGTSAVEEDRNEGSADESIDENSSGASSTLNFPKKAAVLGRPSPSNCNARTPLQFGRGVEPGRVKRRTSEKKATRNAKLKSLQSVIDGSKRVTPMEITLPELRVFFIDASLSHERMHDMLQLAKTSTVPDLLASSFVAKQCESSELETLYNAGKNAAVHHLVPISLAKHFIRKISLCKETNDVRQMCFTSPYIPNAIFSR